MVGLQVRGRLEKPTVSDKNQSTGVRLKKWRLITTCVGKKKKTLTINKTDRNMRSSWQACVEGRNLCL